LLELDPASEAELTEIDNEALTLAVQRVCDDPSGQREPRHSHVRRFRNTTKYVDTGGRDLWEFKTSKWRGLFLIAKGTDHQGIMFVRVKGKRFMTLGECPWHKGK
jgi:hypothetical protein